MTEGPRKDVVNRQYEKWTYPEPIQDLDEWFTNHFEIFDPSHAHRILWPDREYKPDMDILIAGCGTNQAAAIAYKNPGARVVGVDISQASLDHQRFLKDKHGLNNLDLRLLPIEELPTLGLDFDMVMSVGVLHHMADPLTGMKAIAECVRADGVIAVSLYATYGRVGVYALQSAFRDMGLGLNDESVGIVKDTIAMLPPDHLVQAYLRRAPDVHYDAGLVDTFLHGRDRSYTVDECFDLVASAGLEFQGWLNNVSYHPHVSHMFSSGFNDLVNALPKKKLWSVMDHIYTLKVTHTFMACSPDRPAKSYTIDFSSLSCLDYVPSMRVGCRLSGSEVVGPHSQWRPGPEELAYVQLVDGKRTIREITAAAPRSAASSSKSKRERTARSLFESLWRLDFVAMGLSV